MDQQTPTPPRLSRGLFYLITIGLVIVGIAAFIFIQRGSEPAVNIASGPPSALPVNVATVRFDDTYNIADSYTGLIAARRSSSLGFESGGTVKILNKDVGDKVTKGTVLAELDTRSLRANLSATQAQLSEAKAALKIADATVARQKALIDKGLLSTQAFEEADAQALAATARMEAARAQVNAINVRLKMAVLDAPYDGVITKRYLDEGAIAAPGQTIYQLVESQVLETSIGLPGKLASQLMPGQIYPLKIDKQEVPATLRTITGVIDATQRTVTAVFDLEPSSTVVPGAVARLEIKQELEQAGMWIPVSAMTEADRGLWSIYVVRQQGQESRLEKRLVDVIHAEANRVFVRGALQDGELFVVNGLHRLTPGLLVEAKHISSDKDGGS